MVREKYVYHLRQCDYCYGLFVFIEESHPTGAIERFEFYCPKKHQESLVKQKIPQRTSQCCIYEQKRLLFEAQAQTQRNYKIKLCHYCRQVFGLNVNGKEKGYNPQQDCYRLQRFLNILPKAWILMGVCAWCLSNKQTRLKRAFASQAKSDKQLEQITFDFK